MMIIGLTSDIPRYCGCKGTAFKLMCKLSRIFFLLYFFLPYLFLLLRSFAAKRKSAKGLNMNKIFLCLVLYMEKHYFCSYYSELCNFYGCIQNKS